MVIVKATKNSEAGIMPGEDGILEIRPFFEAEDFGVEFTPEMRAREERMRAEIEQQQKN